MALRPHWEAALAAVLVSGALAAACGSSGDAFNDNGAGAAAGAGGSGGDDAGDEATGGSAGAGGLGGAGGSAGSGGSAGAAVDAGSDATAGCGAGCPSGATCGSANGVPVCRAASGIPLFQHVFVLVMENTSSSTLGAAMTAGNAPKIAHLASTYAYGTAYHGVAHPSLPNYVAMTSGDTQGIGCDCKAAPGQGACGFLNCSLLFSGCSCNQGTTAHLANQIESAHKTWMAFGEDMGTPCNLVDTGHYAVRHVPFLYYDDIQTDAARCSAHVVDHAAFDPVNAGDFTFIAPNLLDDMHDPVPANGTNIPTGDAWLGPEVDRIVASPTYQDRGLLVVVWDEDDGSGGITGADDPVPIFVLSPLAKSGGYVSAGKADHYSLLATIEDGLGLPRLGKAGTARSGVADTLADYFPDQ